MIKKIFYTSLVLIGLNAVANAQVDSAKKNDLFAEIDNEAKAAEKNETDYAIATFKSTRVINSQSVEMLGKYNLDFRIAHRFNPLNSGAYEFFGMDGATMRMSFEYGLSNKLMVGIGRSTVDKEYDVFAKFKLLSQSTGKVKMPISLVYFASAMHRTLKENNDLSFSNRMSYAHQVLIARKFSDNVSLQLMPTLVHINMIDAKAEENNLFSLGVGGRVKISKRVAINAEYFPQLKTLNGRTHSFSIGFDIETGGHVFQLHFTNSRGMNERSFITNTTGDWMNGDISFGFNISRIFALKNTSGKKSW